ncbi:hypothetical protein SBRCBS47491_004400 [Sporothrix bragantina]|uniref:Indole-diterpene biosynthesis protein PaxU n=1 Tax=Sporothrix bragantina TaxID=671064 RepID=A0ABP0BNH8_9PEZI
MTSTPDSDTKVLIDPLGFMEKLSSSVYIYRPPTATSTNSSSSSSSTTPSGIRKAPKLVIITAWMGASPAHISKYIAPYRDGLVFGEEPADRPAIVVLFCHVKSTSSYAKSALVAETALPFIQDILGDSLETTPEENSPAASAGAVPQMLVHTLSSGGCLILGHIYNAIDPTHRKCLPPHVTVYDSCPGHFRFKNSVTAFSMGLAKAPLTTRLFMVPTIYLLVLGMWTRIHSERVLAWFDSLGRSIMLSLFGIKPSPKPPGPAKALNPWTPHNVATDFGGNRREVRRAYLYSDEDPIIESRDVEEHSNEAKGLGFTIFRMVKFNDSAHVAHARADPAKYWASIKDLWFGTNEAA